MINWQEIDNKIFEDIAYEYMVNNYPKQEWKKTKLTNDGNKDGESVIANLPFNTTIKYWYEAKYTINTDKSIPKSHLDSTLVSCLIDGHVVAIAFITNAYISNDYRRRADIFARRRDNLKIYYINGEEIEDWLSENPQIEARYFKSHCAEKHDFTDEIEDMCFLDKHSDENQVVKLTTLELNQEYLLYIRFRSSTNQELELVTNQNIELLPIYSSNNLNPAILVAEKGSNAFFVHVKIVSSKNEYDICLRGETGIKKYRMDSIKTLELYKPKLVISSQIKLINDINVMMKTNDLHNLIFWIVGEAGSGKTYTLNTIRNNTQNQFASILLKFSGNAEKDLILCYKLFIFCKFGALWELNVDDLEQFNFHPTVKEALKEICIGITSLQTKEKIREYCIETPEGYVEQYFMQQQIYIDDVHKISSDVADLLYYILQWFDNQKLNKRIFLFSRNSLSDFDNLNNFLHISTCIKEIEKVSSKDVKQSLETNLGRIPMIISSVQNSRQSFNALSLYDFICALNERKDELKQWDEVNVSLETSKIINELIYAEKNKMEGQLFKEYHTSIVFYFVYKLGNGIDIQAIVNFFGEAIYEEISNLCQKHIIKEISGKLYPFHDILLERFRLSVKDKYITRLGEFILFCLEKKYFSQSEGYYNLVALGGKYFWKYRSIAEEFRNQMHDTANYYAAEKIAKKIYEENHKSLCDYDYADIKNLFILGNCYKYTTSYESSNEIFKKIKDVYSVNTMNLSDDILLETYSETVNNNIWMLNIKQADSDLKTMYKIWDFSKDIQNKSKSYKYGCLNYYNRRMFCDYMSGNESEQSYLTALNKAKELNLREYEGFAHMDFAKSIYNIDISKAEVLLKEAKEIFIETNEARRLLDVSSELEYIDAIKNEMYEIETLKEICHSMQDERYIQSYTRTYLKILVIMLLSGKYSTNELLEVAYNILANNSSIATGRRHKALLYHILSAIHYKEGDLKLAKKYSKKCLDLFAQLGESYKQIHLHNSKVKVKCNIVLSCYKNEDFTKNDFILDARIW